MEGFRTELSVVQQPPEPFAQRIRLRKIRLIARRLRDGGATAVDLHIAPTAEQQHLIDRKFDVGIVADVPVGYYRLREGRLEKITRRQRPRLFLLFPPIGIPDACRETEDMNEIGVLQCLVGGALDTDAQRRLPGLCVFVKLLEHLPLALHDSGIRYRVTVRRIAAGVGEQSELIEEDRIHPEFHRKIDVPLQNLQPGTAGGTGDDEGFVDESPQKGAAVGEVVGLPVFRAIRTLDRHARSLPRTVVVTFHVDELTIEVEDDLPPLRLHLADVLLQCLDTAQFRIG